MHKEVKVLQGVCTYWSHQAVCVIINRCRHCLNGEIIHLILSFYKTEIFYFIFSSISKLCLFTIVEVVRGKNIRGFRILERWKWPDMQEYDTDQDYWKKMKMPPHCRHLFSQESLPPLRTGSGFNGCHQKYFYRIRTNKINVTETHRNAWPVVDNRRRVGRIIYGQESGQGKHKETMIRTREWDEDKDKEVDKGGETMVNLGCTPHQSLVGNQWIEADRHCIQNIFIKMYLFSEEYVQLRRIMFKNRK